MAVKTGWSNTVAGNAVVVLGTGTIFGVFYALGAPLYTAVVMVAGAAMILIDQHLDQKHHQEFRDFAELHGWTYTSRTRDYTGRFATYPFGVGLDRHQTGLLEGLYNDHYCVTFTHHWTDNTQPGQHAHKHDFQVTLVEIDADLPRLDLVPESVGTVIEKLVGGSSVDVEVDEFNSRWHARAQDRQYAHAMLAPRLVERLIEPDTRGLSVRFEGRAVMMWQEGRLGTEGLSRRLDLLTTLADRIPVHVLLEHGGSPPAVHPGEPVALESLDDNWQQNWFTDKDNESP